MNGRRKVFVLGICATLCLLAFSSCAGTPAVIDTTAVDTVIVDLADTAGDIETQTVTVYQTVKEYIKDPAELAKVTAEFDKLNASIAHLKNLPAELARVHAVEVGKLAAEISRLQPFEVEAEKQKSGKWQAYAIIAGLVSLISAGVFLKLRGFI
jgi:hypothetical protein